LGCDVSIWYKSWVLLLPTFEGGSDGSQPWEGREGGHTPGVWGARRPPTSARSRRPTTAAVAAPNPASKGWGCLRCRASACWTIANNPSSLTPRFRATAAADSACHDLSCIATGPLGLSCQRPSEPNNSLAPGDSACNRRAQNLFPKTVSRRRATSATRPSQKYRDHTRTESHTRPRCEARYEFSSPAPRPDSSDGATLDRIRNRLGDVNLTAR
jgi:hypothetical protein